MESNKQASDAIDLSHLVGKLKEAIAPAISELQLITSQLREVNLSPVLSRATLVEQRLRQTAELMKFIKQAGDLEMMSILRPAAVEDIDPTLDLINQVIEEFRQVNSAIIEDLEQLHKYLQDAQNAVDSVHPQARVIRPFLQHTSDFMSRFTSPSHALDAKHQG